MSLQLDKEHAGVRESSGKIGPARADSPAADKARFVSRSRLAVLGAVLLIAALVAVSSFARDDNDAGLLEKAREVFPPLPKYSGTAEYPTTPERVRLGQMLFFDPRISDDGTMIPGLRGVAMTPPYFHDGSVNELPRAVRIMAKVQLDLDLGEAEVNMIVAFLESLTGPPPAGFERPPLLPAGVFVNPPAHRPH